MDKEGSVFAALLEEDSLAYSDSFICGSGLLDNTQVCYFMHLVLPDDYQKI